MELGVVEVLCVSVWLYLHVDVTPDPGKSSSVDL